MFSEVCFSRGKLSNLRRVSAVVTFCCVGKNSKGHTMDDSESISVFSEGRPAVNAYGSIVGDHEVTGSCAMEV